MKNDPDKSPQELEPAEEAPIMADGPAKPAHKKSSLGHYLILLFAAALLLMILSYLMQQRSNDQVLSGLKESVSAITAIGNLQDQMDAVNAENAALKMELTRSAAALQSEIAASSELALQSDALDRLRFIEEKIAKKNYTSARTLIDDFIAAGRREHLPSETDIEFEGVTPATERFDKIYASLY